MATAALSTTDQSFRKLQHVTLNCKESSMSRLNNRSSRLKGGGDSLHADICGICPSEATTVSVNEPLQVLTMHAAGSQELCVIMRPREKSCQEHVRC